jgi:integrase
MTDIRKRVGKNGTTYQVRHPSKATQSGYAYKSFDTLKEARDFIESGGARQTAGLRRSPVKTVRQAIDMWLEICEREGRDERDPVSPSTLENYRWRARTMTAYGWDRDLYALQEADVIAFRSWLKRNCTADQAQKVMSSFHSVLIEMKRRGIIGEDPAQNVAIRMNPRHKEPVKIPSVEELQAILQAADRLANSRNNEIASAWERYRPMVYLAADSGMRPQEYLVLPTEALEERGVKVLQALDRSNRIAPPKTKAGRRYIPVSLESLGMARHYADKYGAGGFVFPTRREGGYQRYNVFVRRGFHKLMEEAGLVTEVVENGQTKRLKHYTPYSLRHFFASMLIEQNKSLKYIQTVMGHENIKMTFDVYGHIIRRKETDELNDAGGILQYVS